MSPQVKQAVIRKIKVEGCLIKEVALEYGVSTRQVYSWLTRRRQYTKQVPQEKVVHLESEVRHLKAQLQQAETSLEWQDDIEQDVSYCDANYIRALCG
ncbi:MAG: transposase [Gammaproteobacteria bacterium]|nr:transposase [Gammaproteobacteria bacterium]NVK88716.1 transposase [Gammaproteobacteria bacterium]